MLQPLVVPAIVLTVTVTTGMRGLPASRSGTADRLCTRDAQPAGPAAPTPAVAADISQLDWLAGTWISGTGENVVEERWTPPAGGSMLSVSRTIRNGAMSEFEFLCIVERHGGLVYQAMPNGRQPPTEFALTSLAPGRAVFENPGHDFPTTIRYTLGADGTLEAVVSGSAGQKPLTVRFRKR